MENQVPPITPNWDDRPGPKDKDYVKVYRAKPGQRHVGIMLAEGITGLWCHFDAGHTRPCLAGAAQCPYCARGQGGRWQGYLPVMFPNSGFCGLLEVSHQAVDQAVGVIHPLGHLRGHLVTISKRGNFKGSPIALEIGRKTDTSHLPPCFDVYDALCRLWFGPGLKPVHPNMRPRPEGG